MEPIKLKGPPKAYQDYLKREKDIEIALQRNALSRMLFIIIDSQPNERYNDALAKKYYSVSNSKKLPNPKVTAIHLRQLRDAHFIKRVEKQGKYQFYDIDWNGLFDVLRFYNFSEFSLRKKSFNVRRLFYSCLMSKTLQKDGSYKTSIADFSAPYTEEKTEQASEEIVNNYFKPYLERAVKIYKTYAPVEEDDDGFPVYWEDKIPKNFDTIDFPIIHVLTKFDAIFFDSFPNTFSEEIGAVLNLKKSKKLSLSGTLILNYFRNFLNETKDYFQYCDSSLPEFVLLEAFNKEIKNLDYQIEQFDINEDFIGGKEHDNSRGKSKKE